jgi:uncharacterized membrane protein
VKSIKAYCKKKGVVPSVKAYFIDAMSAMALGLFASLLIGTIFAALGMIPGLSFFSEIAGFCGYGKVNGVSYSAVCGAAMAVAIANALKAPPLVTYSLAAVGCAANVLGAGGGPLAVFVIAILAVEVGKLVSKTTKVDILVTPFVTVFTGVGSAILFAKYIGYGVEYVKELLGWATEQTPLLMGLLVSVVMGMALTLPISSAAICAGLSLTGLGAVTNEEGLALAGAAAVAGCCAQMVGFAVMSFKENGWGGLVSQGLGTSMLQMPNIIKKPIVWLPPIIASAVTGPLATCLFDMKMYGTGIFSGMGTCGLLGPVGLVIGWLSKDGPKAGLLQWVGLVLVCFLLPAAICLGLGALMRKLGWIKKNDLKLEL